MLLNAQPEGLRLPAEFGLNADDEAQFRDACWELIVKGVTDPEELGDYAADEIEISDAVARRAAEYLVAARRAQQASFGDLPSSKLDRAFAALEDKRIIARQDWTCCGTCGASEIGNDVDNLTEWLGYVFFHTQDTDSLIEMGNTYLSYGIFWPSHLSEDEFDAMSEDECDAYYERETVKLMQDVVVPTLESHDIGVEWDGDMGTRILITDVEWYAPI